MAFKVFYHDEFYEVYTSDPAAASGRMEAVVAAIKPFVEFMPIEPIFEDYIRLVHTDEQIERVRWQKLHSIASLAAGGAYQSAALGLSEPCFALIRPPGHHASSGNAWGFCFYNNMAIAIEALKREGKIKTATILDIDMHYGDGTVNILKEKDYVDIHNFETEDRDVYLKDVETVLKNCSSDIIGISAGFDNHVEDWGGVLETDDYTTIGRLVLETSRRINGGCFGILEGGYNHDVLGQNVLALINGLQGN
ncbi:MAG: histone deacetylase family protein [Proteobacteria bacterium]|nr:histone deacetylase family protein [Pseudomonadota bacterium]